MKVAQISFILGCRNCYNSDGVPHLIMDQNGNAEEYLRMTEYEMVEIIEGWREEEGKVCEFCGSANVEIDNVSVNNQPLFDSETVGTEKSRINEFILELWIQKNNNKANIGIGGHTYMSRGFIILCFELIISKMYLIPKDYFKNFPKGHFNTCISGPPDSKNFMDIKFERLQFAGYSKSEIIELLTTKMNEYISSTSKFPLFNKDKI
jgi:hypothetical protein